MLIDLNAERSARAAKREGAGENVRVPFGDDVYLLPPELPASVVDHLLDPEVEIAQLLIAALRAVRNGTADENAGAVIAQVLADRPDLPMGFVRAVLGAVEQLFGTEQWEKFLAQGPSAQDQIALIKGLLKVYGTGLGEAFKSSASSTAGGTTSKPTSNASTESTPEVSGPDQEPPASLASVG